MATEVILPKLGLAQEEGTIVRWLKPEGSRVSKGEPLFEVMTDKATLEVESPASGMLLRVLVPEGATVPVAAAIAVIGEPGEPVPAAPERAPAAGSGSASREARAAEERGAETDARVPGERVRISPRARALAAARGLDVRVIHGTGPGGRIVERDVQQALAARTVSRAVSPAASPATESPAPPVSPGPRATPDQAHAHTGLGLRREPEMPAGTGTAPPSPAPSTPIAARMRTIIARRMLESLRTTAQLTLTTEADMAEAVRLREEIAPELERRDGVSVTYTDLVVRAAALALREHPALNARWEGEGPQRLDEIHIGVAVSLDDGLVVPVVRHADRATVSHISAAIRDLSERARALRLRPEEMQGGTFTVTNLGMFEIDAFTPILNPPEAAILGVGRVHRRPAAVGDRVEIRAAMALSLTFDHRIVDGAPAAQFLQRIKHLLEHPYLLLLP